MIMRAQPQKMHMIFPIPHLEIGLPYTKEGKISGGREAGKGVQPQSIGN